MGKYYLDDGPPDAVPGDLANVPEAVPREEPFHKFANRPYTVFGITYVPVVNKERTVQRGIASWYGKKFQAQKTA
jgi:rare lipoprotein A